LTLAAVVAAMACQPREGYDDELDEAQEAAEDAEEAVRETGRDVRDELDELGEEIEPHISDAALTATIKAKLAADPQINPFDIDVDTTDGTVSLSGQVESAEQKAEAEKLARMTEGVVEVINLIEVESMPGPS
jgi:osmotically-inducible protein OsmY